VSPSFDFHRAATSSPEMLVTQEEIRPLTDDLFMPADDFNDMQVDEDYEGDGELDQLNSSPEETVCPTQFFMDVEQDDDGSSSILSEPSDEQDPLPPASPGKPVPPSSARKKSGNRLRVGQVKAVSKSKKSKKSKVTFQSVKGRKLHLKQEEQGGINLAALLSAAEESDWQLQRAPAQILAKMVTHIHRPPKVSQENATFLSQVLIVHGESQIDPLDRNAFRLSHEAIRHHPQGGTHDCQSCRQ
jgi:hypothetical protein